MYRIELATLLQMLQGFQHSGTLYTKLYLDRYGRREHCDVYLTIVEGQVVSCSISSSGRENFLSGSEALNLLGRMGALDWMLSLHQSPPARLRGSHTGVPSPSIPLLPAKSQSRTYGERLPTVAPPLPVRQLPITEQSIPGCIGLVDQQKLNSWPRKQRRVYVLIDGGRSVKKIAEILSLSPETIEQVLRELQLLRVIVIG